MDRSDLLGPEATAYAIADNRTAELAGWDDTILAEALAGVATADSTLAMATGFSETEIERLIARVGGLTDGTDDDAAPEPPAVAESCPGTLYELSGHRLLCGDATRPDHLRLLAGERRMDLLLTDPPYNVAYQGKTAEGLTIANDSMASPQFRRFLTAAFLATDRVLRPGAAFYIWHADSEGLNFRLACQDAGWPIHECLVWAKDTFVLGRQDYQWQHEPCLYGWKPGAAHQWCGDRRQSTLVRSKLPWHLVPAPDGSGYIATLDGSSYLIRGENLTVTRTDTTLLECPRPQRNGDHPTMKPVELFERLIRNSTRRGQAVLDPFGGSGTTLIAAERAGRVAHLAELDPRYADVIRRRWAELVHGHDCPWQKLTPSIDTLADDRNDGRHPGENRVAIGLGASPGGDRRSGGQAGAAP